MAHYFSSITKKLGSKTNPIKLFCSLLLSIFLMFFLFACTDNSTPESISYTEPQNGGMDIILKNSAFVPGNLKFKAGEVVELRLKSTDEAHTFSIEELGVNWMIPKTGDPIVKEFVFNTPGTYSLICIIAGHASAGMVGEVLVQ